MSDLDLRPDVRPLQAEIEQLQADVEEWKNHHQTACLSVVKLRAALEEVKREIKYGRPIDIIDAALTGQKP